MGTTKTDDAEHRGANKIRNQLLLDAAVAKAKGSRISDGAGLYVNVPLRAWRLDYTYGGKRQTMSLGPLANVSLVQARQARDDAWALLAAGKSPTAERKTERVQVKHAAKVERLVRRGAPLPDTFADLFTQWHRNKLQSWSQSYAVKVKARIERGLLADIGAMPVGQITEADLLVPLERVQEQSNRTGGNKIESAHALAGYAGQIFRFAIRKGKCRRNPAFKITEALMPLIVQNHAAITEPRDFARMMHVINEYPGFPTTRAALLFHAMCAQRPGNTARARWADIDLAERTWSIPSGEMKRSRQAKLSGRPHVVPLSAEAVALLREIQPLTGQGEFVFKADYTSARPLSENTLNAALRRLGIGKLEQVGHGFRASFRTIAAEHLHIDENVLEAILAHAKPGLGTAYNRAEWQAQQRAALEQWGAVVMHAARTGEWSTGLAKPAPAPAPAPTTGPAALVAAIERLTGQRVSVDALKAALAAPAPAKARRPPAKGISRVAKAASRA
jgi:integrase